ncbi:MAG: hypothetical protein GWP17_07105 [Aquificales bacterium]|nr:hypothetical protein [Aquificales bacterium]
MKTILTVEDPLEGQAVTIIITLPVNQHARDARPALVSVRVADQMPVIKTGLFGNIAGLIDEAWTAFGVQAEVAKAAQKGKKEAAKTVETAVAPELITEASTETEADAPVPAPTPEAKPEAKPKPVAPKPAGNLSLF